MLDHNQPPEQAQSSVDQIISDFKLQLPQLETIIETNPPTVAPEMLVIDVLEYISQHETSGSASYNYVLVTDELNKLIGILTERDIVRLTATQQDLATITVGEVMSRDVITLKKTNLSDISNVLSLLRQHKIRHLPIISDRQQIEGIISFNGICQAIHPSSLLKFRRVSEVMNSEVLHANPSTTVLELSQLMLSNYKSYVVIVETRDGDQQLIPIGIITERDIIKLQLKKIDIAQTEAHTVMSHPLECLNPQDHLLIIQQKMNLLQVRRLVITGEQGELKGIVTQLNMLRGIDTAEIFNIITTLQQQLYQKTQKIRQTNESLKLEVLQRLAAENQLKKEKELAQITLKSIGDGVITTDITDRIEEFNPAAESLTGWQAEEVRGKHSSVIQVIDEISKNTIATPFMRVLRDETHHSSIVRSVLIARDGTEYAIRDCVSPIRDRQGEIVGAVWIFHDVTESRRLTAQLSWQATHDTLTGLYNRRKFTEKLAQAIISAREESKQHTLCYCDLDQFKIVNDTCGHGAGDALLRQITELLSRRVRAVDTLARLGGDEFGLLLYQCPISEAVTVVNILRQTIANYHFTWNEQVFSIGVSVGIVAIDSTTNNLNQLMNIADTACYTAKAKGRNCIHIASSADS